MSFKIKYLGEIQSIFETNLALEEGDQVGTSDSVKTRGQKSHAYVSSNH